MATILRELSSGLYTSGKAVGHFYPHTTPPLTDAVPAKGLRFGDWDELSLEVTVGEETARQSKEHTVPVNRLSNPGEITVTVNATVAQLSDWVRAASVMGDVGVRTQTAQSGVTKTLAEPGVYFLGFFGITNVVVSKADASVAILGEDYLLDAVSGQIETIGAGMDGAEVEFDAPALTTGYMSGIASSDGIRGMIMIRMVNKQGVRSLIRLHDLQLRPNGARSLVIDGTEISTIQLTGTAFPVSGKPAGFEIGYEMDITEETVGGI